MLLMKPFRSYYPIIGLKNNPINRIKEKKEILCKGNAETLTSVIGYRVIRWSLASRHLPSASFGGHWLRVIHYMNDN